MIKHIVTGISKTSSILERLADRETLKAQAKLTQASVLVQAAGAHRTAAATGRKVAGALRDLVA
jgi:hypothetical protein